MPGLTSCLVTVVFANCLEARVNRSDVEVENSAVRSKEARLNPSSGFHGSAGYAAFEAG
jgi:hypothetical protein